MIYELLKTMRNIFMKMKNKNLKIIATFVLLLFIVVYACREEFGDSIEAQENSQAIEFAKNWYEMNKPEVPAFRSSDGRVEILMKPDWTTAFTKKNGKYETVESDLMTFGMFYFIHPECMEKFNETKDMNYKRSYSRVVFRTDRKTNETVGFLMTMIPNLKFLEDTKFKPFKKSHYLDRDSKFGGWILFHNLDGSFSNGCVYENGKVTGSIGYFDIGPVDFNFRSGSCTIMEIYMQIWNCPSWYNGSENGYSTYCYIENEVYLGYQVLWCDDEEGGEDYNGNGGSGNGNGGNPTVQPRNDCPPEAAANSTTTNNVLNSNSGGDAQVKSNVDLLRNYASTKSIEYGLAVDKTGNQYTVHNQNSNFPNTDPLYIKEGTSSGVSVSYNANTYFFVHIHTSGGISAPAPNDVIALARAYSKGNNPAVNIQGSVIFCSNGCEYLIYVNNRNQLNVFCNNQLNDNFFESNGANFKSGSIFEEYFNNARTNLSNKGYSENDAVSYALSHVLDWFNTGLKISKKEPGKTDFKEQKTDWSTSGSNQIYTPKICP